MDQENVRSFSRSTDDDMFFNVMPVLTKKMIRLRVLNVGTNNTTKYTSTEISDLLKLRSVVHKQDNYKR